tara:strand:+ start:124 stop:882 length:759 start_codon:yes stop_codon:yes gene_type:complete
MDSKSFKDALTDLYNHYNPAKLKEVEKIVKNYNGREYDAIKTLILRYNFKGHPSYNESANRDEYVNYIISNYSEGKRVASKEAIKKQNEKELLKKLEEEESAKRLKEEEKASIINLAEDVKKEIDSQIEKVYNNLELLINEKTKDIGEYFQEKKIEFQEQEASMKSITGQTVVNEIVKEEKNHTRVNIENLNFTMSDIELPDESVLEKLSKGTKLIVKTSEGRVCGIEVTDVTYDLVSYENEVVKEIILTRI